MVDNAKAAKIVMGGLAEIGRVLGAMIALFTTLWFFGRPAADEYINNMIKAQNLPSRQEIVTINRDIEELQSTDQVIIQQENTTSKAVERLGAQVDNIEKLAAEQRNLSTQILLELRRK